MKQIFINVDRNYLFEVVGNESLLKEPQTVLRNNKNPELIKILDSFKESWFLEIFEKDKANTPAQL